MARNALGYEFYSAVRLSKRPGSVCNCLWGHALKIYSGINHKSSVLCPGPRFLPSATRPSLLNNHYNGLTNQSINSLSPYTTGPVAQRADSLSSGQLLFLDTIFQ